MRIAYVSDRYNPEVGEFLKEAAYHISDIGHKITLYTSDAPYFTDANPEPRKDIVVKRYKGIRVGEFVVFPGMIKNLIKEDSDIIHAFLLGSFSTAVCGYLRAVKNTPLVVRADFSVEEKNLPSKMLYNFFWKNIPLHIADVLTVHTKLMKTVIQRRYNINPNKVEIIPNGIDFDKFNKAVGEKKEDLGIKNKFMILNVSRICDSKNPKMIVEALPILKNVTEEFIFIHMGPRWDKKYFFEVVNTAKKMKVADKIKFLGFVPHNKLPDYYKSADVYVQSGKDGESFGLSTLEAMAAGIPVISTKTGAIGCEYFNKYDYWVSTSEELGEKLIKLYLSQSARKKLGKKLTAIAKSYDWSIVVKRLEKIYMRCLEGESEI